MVTSVVIVVVPELRLPPDLVSDIGSEEILWYERLQRGRKENVAVYLAL